MVDLDKADHYEPSVLDRVCLLIQIHFIFEAYSANKEKISRSNFISGSFPIYTAQF